MLLQLLIRNIALIDQIELSFGEGLHVMTGETGAGKSIVVDAMNLLLGGRADRELIRTGCEKAYAEGLFDLQDCPGAKAWLKAHDMEDDENCMTLSREISATGRSVCRIQGMSVPLSLLREVAALMMDLHGQHEHQSLLDDKNHLQCLDAMGNEMHQRLIAETADAYSAYHAAGTAYKRMKRESAHREERLESLREQEAELAAANLMDGEEEELRQERERYRSGEKITQALREAFGALYESGGGKLPAVEQARSAMRALAPIDRLGKEYESLHQRAESLYYDLEDLGLSIRAALDEMDDDPQRAQEVEERLDMIRKLSRKYGATCADMLKSLERIREELLQYESMEDTLEKLHKKALLAYREYKEAAERLSQSRRALAKSFETRMESQLNDLNMKGTRFMAAFSEEDKGASANGSDNVRFMIAPNAGEEGKPLSKIASGGELSRVMLSLKALSAERAAIPSMIFDEIDTGISGRTAQVVAQKMWDIAKYRQVICVTHLQQIAAMATRHYLVQKGESNGRTNTSVIELTGDARIEEITRMISGVSANSESALTHARGMLEEAAQYRQGKL